MEQRVHAPGSNSGMGQNPRRESPLKCDLVAQVAGLVSRERPNCVPCWGGRNTELRVKWKVRGFQWTGWVPALRKLRLHGEERVDCRS